MNKFTWKRVTLPEAEDQAGLRTRTIATEIQPMLCGTAFRTRACSGCSTP